MTKSLRILLPDDLHRKAKIKAAMTSKPIAQVCREAIKEWAGDIVLDGEQPKKK